jgi:hypothetical protein
MTQPSPAEVIAEAFRMHGLTDDMRYNVERPRRIAEIALAALEAAGYSIVPTRNISRDYTAEDRERWRTEIQEAKRTMNKAEFADWLYRRVNTVGMAQLPPSMYDSTHIIDEVLGR